MDIKTENEADNLILGTPALLNIIRNGISGPMPRSNNAIANDVIMGIRLHTPHTVGDPSAVIKAVNKIANQMRAGAGAPAPAGAVPPAQVGPQGPAALPKHFVVKILQPDPHDPIQVPLEVEASTGNEYHGHFVFMCEVTGGVGPFKYKWDVNVKPPGGGWSGWKHFWPYDQDGDAIKNLNNIPATNEREDAFFKGGYDDQAPNNFHYFQPLDPSHMDDPWASLPEGQYKVRVTVLDTQTKEMRDATSIFSVVRQSRGRLRVVITQPQKPDGKDMPEFPVKREPTTQYSYHDPIQFSCEVSGGTGNYLYEWMATGIDPNTFSPVTRPIPLNFVSRRSFSRGGLTHPIENQADPEASLRAGLYKITVKVEDINNDIVKEAYAHTFIRIGEIGSPSPRSRISSFGPTWLTRPAVRPGGGITGPYGSVLSASTDAQPGIRGGYLRKQAVAGGLERARYRLQNPMAGMGRGFGTSERRFGQETTKGSTGRDIDYTTISRNPAVQAAINHAKRELNRWARSLTSPIFQKQQAEFKALKKRWDDSRKDWRDVRRKVRQKVGTGSYAWSFLKTQGEGDAALEAIARKIADEDERKMLNDEVERTYNAFTKADSDLLNFTHEVQEALEKEIKGKLDKIVEPLAKRAAYKFKVPGTFDVIKAELEIEKDETVETLVKYGKDRLAGPMGALRSASLSAKTLGSSYFALINMIKMLLFGPWTWTTILAIVQFFFVLNYVGYNPQLVYIMPLISASFVFLLNFSDVKMLFDGVTHFMSGAAIGYSAELLLVALGAPSWSFIGGTASFGFWIAWIILCFIGIFQFYQVGE